MKRFISVYQDIKQALDDNNPPAVTGLWLIHGDDELLHQWFIDACRPLFDNNHQLIKRISLHTPKDWQGVLSKVASLSLFDDKVAVITDGKARPATDLFAPLTQFAKNPNDNAIIYSLPYQDKKSQNSKWFGIFKQYGTVIDAKIYDENMRLSLLKIKASDYKLTLNTSAWQFLMTHTENNLLSAHQALMRLVNLTDNTAVLGVDDIMPALVSDYTYSVFNLCDTLLLGDSHKALRILYHLKNTNTAPSLILWAIAKEIHLVLNTKDGQSFDSLGIWQSKASLYRTAIHNNHIHTDMLDNLYQIDKSIKGLSDDTTWQQLEILCLNMCGINTLSKI